MSALTISIGQRLGHYRILQKIGAGGMGAVYRAHDDRLDRDVALKVLPPGRLTNDNAQKRFRKEALTLSRLNHPNIAAIYDFDSEAGIDFLVMELIPGVTLSEKLAGRPLPEHELLPFAQQIVLALEHAHEHGVVHCDLKPGNVIIRPDGLLKVVDFGIAKLLTISESAPTETLTSLQEMAGTVPYMSPEQLQGKPPDHRSDIYAAGAVLYEMATGRCPFHEKHLAALTEAILHSSPVPPRQVNSSISAGLESIILKCLEKAPQNRYQAARELSVDLRRLQTASGAARIPESVEARAPARWMTVVLAALVLVAAVLLFVNKRDWRGRLGLAGKTHSITSLAVLPLENRSSDPDQEYFADGMTDELTAELANIRALRVVSRTSAMRYKRTTKTLPEIAQELNVDGVIEGSVLSSDGSVRITAQLVEAQADKQLWAHSYQRELKDVLQLQGELARDIAEQIKVEVTPQERLRWMTTRTVDPGAHEAYLKGLYHWNQGNEEHYREARRYFEQAIALDPKYAPAYSGLADYYWVTDELPPQIAMPRAKQNARKALEIDDSLPNVHKTLAVIDFYGDWDWPGAEKEFRRALELNPSYSEGHRMYAVYLSSLDRVGDALREIQSAQQLDPLSLRTTVSRGWIFYYGRQYDAAIQQCQNVLALDSQLSQAHDCLGSSYAAKGNFSQALAEAQQAASEAASDPVHLAGLAWIYALADKPAEARKILADLNKLSKSQYIAPYFFVMINGALGDKDQAFAWLEKGYQGHDAYFVRLKVDVALDPLRSDPRFEQLLRRVGLSH